MNVSTVYNHEYKSTDIVMIVVGFMSVCPSLSLDTSLPPQTLPTLMRMCVNASASGAFYTRNTWTSCSNAIGSFADETNSNMNESTAISAAVSYT